MTGQPHPPAGGVTIAVIPTYRAPAELAERVRALLDEVDGVVLVDDGTASTSALGLDDPRVTVIELAENSGIAHALNVGIDAARSAGAQYILTLDQDSWVHPGYVAAAVGLLSDAIGTGTSPTGAVPASAGGQPIPREPDGRPFDPIQAGQVLRMEMLDRIGPFEEDFFIDAVDSEYGLRVRDAGSCFLVVDGSDIGHELGALVPLTVFGRPVSLGGRVRHVIYHAPFRTYYMVRNSIVLRRRFGRDRKRWFRRRERLLATMIIAGVLTAPDRRLQILALRRGIADGRADRLGRIPRDLEARLSATGSRQIP